jgi:hypothetical protein
MASSASTSDGGGYSAVTKKAPRLWGSLSVNEAGDADGSRGDEDPLFVSQPHTHGAQLRNWLRMSHVMIFLKFSLSLLCFRLNRSRMKTKVDIRPAVPKDIPTILEFIQQLANFEKCPERVFATHATLATTLGLETEPTAAEVSIDATQLKPGQFAKCVIAEVDDKDAGFAIFFYNYSTVQPFLQPTHGWETPR